MSRAAVKQPSQTEVWNAQDVAAYLRLSVNAVYSLERRGRIPKGRRLGTSRVMRWPAAEIKSLVTEPAGA